MTGLTNGDGYMWRDYEDWVNKALDEASAKYFGPVRLCVFLFEPLISLSSLSSRASSQCSACASQVHVQAFQSHKHALLCVDARAHALKDAHARTPTPTFT